MKTLLRVCAAFLGVAFISCVGYSADPPDLLGATIDQIHDIYGKPLWSPSPVKNADKAELFENNTSTGMVLIFGYKSGVVIYALTRKKNGKHLEDLDVDRHLNRSRSGGAGWVQIPKDPGSDDKDRAYRHTKKVGDKDPVVSSGAYGLESSARKNLLTFSEGFTGNPAEIKSRMLEFEKSMDEAIQQATAAAKLQ